MNQEQEPRKQFQRNKRPPALDPLPSADPNFQNNMNNSKKTVRFQPEETITSQDPQLKYGAPKRQTISMPRPEPFSPMHVQPSLLDYNMLDQSLIYLDIATTFESASVEQIDGIQLQFNVKHGNQWKIIHGEKKGFSQPASSNSQYSQHVSWNLPHKCILETSNLGGWPMYTIQIWGLDFFGRNVLEGYGTVHFPSQSGTHERTVYLYKPKPISWITGLLGYLTNKLPKFLSPDTVISSGDSREAIRAQTVGWLKIKFNIQQINMEKYGYT